ncbi:MAG: phospho-sugar mutase [Deltaproteobacteria bacterium]|nr:phospho-sugar mutase [Deltaproteobacteria bacterium]
MSPETLSRARKFLADDPDPETRAELEALVAKAERGDGAAGADLEDRFAGTLSFGTAGLRGRVEAGSARMNRSVVIQASWGVGTYLLEQGPQFGVDARKRGVVVAFDGRLSSRRFAEDTCAVLAALGIPALVFIDPVPTPVCAFTVEHLGAAAGVMVTASHNPPADNGYKVYWANAAQITPPHDTGIAACIARAPAATRVERVAPPDAAASGLRRIVSDDVERAYLDAVGALAWHRAPAGPAPLRIVYTAMHGVGHRLALRALAHAGFVGVVDEPTQADPDGTFRTVAFPNPEEKGALDRAIAVAKESAADLILANDPDADRLAVAVLSGGGYRLLSGNEIGMLVCADALDHMPLPAGARQKLVITTIVSSTFLSRMARDKGAAYAETLTGFKWIANKAMERAAHGEHFVCGYEEALGYSVGPLVKDKDGIGAAVRFAELARALKAQGKTVLDRLDELFIAHGLSHAVNWSVTMPGATGMERIKASMAALRRDPPVALDGTAVARVDDLARGDHPADVVVLHTADGTRLTVRPSGTEPKIKMYCELVARVAARAELGPARERLEAAGQRIKAELNARLGL